jgi:formylglycine-generating enzyme required for sulfatase activity
MSAVAAGSVRVGKKDTSVAAFEIDAQEVSVGDFAECVRAGACTLYASGAGPALDTADQHAQSSQCRGGRPDRADEPMNCIDVLEADAYCKWIGKRLPSRAEWTLALDSLPEERRKERHRPARNRYWFAAEWTSSGAVPAQPEARSVRWLCAWGTSEARSGPDYWRTRFWRKSALAREPAIGFRCAR